MKKGTKSRLLFFAFILSFATYKCAAQNVGINSTGAAPNSSAMLDIVSTNKGLLIPRLTTVQMNAIASPVIGLIIYNTDCNSINYYNGNAWVALGNTGSISTPGAITGNTTPCQNSTGVTYFIAPVSGATGYNWTVPTGASIASGQGTATITVNFGTANGSVCVTATNACGSSTASCTAIALASSATPSAPVTGVHILGQTLLTWVWNSVAGATGYKYNTVNNYSTAIDNGTGLNYAQTGLTCNTAYTLYVWAYSTCTNSTAATLTATTSACFSCGSALAITHTIGTVAPETKSINYGTVTTSLSGASKCWITQNLGSTNQAGSATDATEASAGWYWQFNRKQGYKAGPTPAWTITAINENSNWVAVNDPCTIELGTGWRIPTSTEWTNAAAGWNNCTDTYGSVLRLHTAGFLFDNDGFNASRGVTGSYWGSTQDVNTNGWALVFDNSLRVINSLTKAYGFSLRCLKDQNFPNVYLIYYYLM